MRAAVIGILVAGLASFLVWSYLRRFEDEASGGPRVQVLTVTRTIEPGAILKDSDIGERGIPQAYVEARAIRATDRQKIANLRIAAALDAQEVLNWTDIMASNDERTMSSIVQQGMRAITIRTEGASGAIARPGDRVDVIATVQEKGSSDHRTGVLLLQNVLVLGHPLLNTTTNGGNEGQDTILSLTPQQSQLLSVAADKAKLSIALRGPEDVRVLEGLVDISSTVIGEAEKRAIVAKGKPGPQQVK